MKILNAIMDVATLIVVITFLPLVLFLLWWADKDAHVRFWDQKGIKNE